MINELKYLNKENNKQLNKWKEEQQTGLNTKIFDEKNRLKI